MTSSLFDSHHPSDELRASFGIFVSFLERKLRTSEMLSIMGDFDWRGCQNNPASFHCRSYLRSLMVDQETVKKLRSSWGNQMESQLNTIDILYSCFNQSSKSRHFNSEWEFYNILHTICRGISRVSFQNPNLGKNPETGSKGEIIF